jgi:hypothetical protein
MVVVRSQVAHSNVRSSNPGFPADVRAKPILCLQVGHIGRSDKVFITHHPRKSLKYFCVVACPVSYYQDKTLS